MTNSDIDYEINAINNDGTGLTQWEEEFMESVTEQWERTHKLSAYQMDKLEEIYGERC